MKFLKLLLTEMALPSEQIKAEKYYHGVSTLSGKSGLIAAQGIVKSGGLDPEYTEIKYAGNEGSTFKPVKNRVYITPYVNYAGAYAMGGGFIGSYKKTDNPPSWLLEHEDSVGYIFEFSGDVLKDVQPDEDIVGDKFSAWLHVKEAQKRGKPVSEYYSQSFGKIEQNMPARIKHEVQYFFQNYQPSTKRRILEGEMAWVIKFGKAILRKMTDAEKLDFIHAFAKDCHLAHDGFLPFSKIYRFDIWEAATTPEEDFHKILEEISPEELMKAKIVPFGKKEKNET